MKELQHLQSERLKRLLIERNTTQKELAEKLEVSPTSVNHWVNGKVHMNDYNANLIHAVYPEYSVEYLRGYSEYPNRQCEEAAIARKAALKEITTSQCVEHLAASRGFRAKGIGYFDPAEYGELVKDCWQPITKLKSVEGVERIENGNGEALELSDEQWSYFVDEIGGYIEMRLGQMIERGCW